jgi:hypothetical protein
MVSAVQPLQEMDLNGILGCLHITMVEVVERGRLWEDMVSWAWSPGQSQGQDTQATIVLSCRDSYRKMWSWTIHQAARRKVSTQGLMLLPGISQVP